MVRASEKVEVPSPETLALTKATLLAADKLGLSNRILASVIGLSAPSIARMKRGAFRLEQGKKQFELSVLFVRLYAALDAIVSGDDQAARAWLRDHNLALRGVPLDLIQSISGLINVIHYLDARRAVG